MKDPKTEFKFLPPEKTPTAKGEMDPFSKQKSLEKSTIPTKKLESDAKVKKAAKSNPFANINFAQTASFSNQSNSISFSGFDTDKSTPNDPAEKEVSEAKVSISNTAKVCVPKKEREENMNSKEELKGINAELRSLKMSLTETKQSLKEISNENESMQKRLLIAPEAKKKAEEVVKVTREEKESLTKLLGTAEAEKKAVEEDLQKVQVENKMNIDAALKDSQLQLEKANEE